MEYGLRRRRRSFTKFLLQKPVDEIKLLNDDCSQTKTNSDIPTTQQSSDIQLNNNLNCSQSTSYEIPDKALPRVEVDLFSDSDKDSINSDKFNYEEINITSENDELETNSVEHSDDPSDWPLKLTDSIRISLIKKGPVKFSDAYYQRILNNGEKIERSCFKKDSGMVSECGYNDWRNLTGHLKIHETSKTHILHFSTWHEMVIKLKLNQTIDSHNQRKIESEIKHWRSSNSK
ncbi:zinc finger MYM-type protein 5-like [Daktulosphaira vitifoliae]|uniref:zinc finger MYM-type protein 5-like n=1 Tax=Daktulosphaira vitifoliae TaxID=58002 RepID=UPI0021A9FFA1|nr:zinc finger MYM-type protein 5-like [Daktulosphaira vitifoliae]